MIVKLLTEHHLEFLSLKGGCRGSSESTHVKIPHCWKSHALAQFYFSISVIELSQRFDVCRDPEASRLPVHSSKSYQSLYSQGPKVIPQNQFPIDCNEFSCLQASLYC